MRVFRSDRPSLLNGVAPWLSCGCRSAVAPLRMETVRRFCGSPLARGCPGIFSDGHRSGGLAMRMLSGCTLLVAMITASWAGEAPAQQARKKAGNRLASRGEADRPPARGLAVLGARFGTAERWFGLRQLIR